MNAASRFSASECQAFSPALADAVQAGERRAAHAAMLEHIHQCFAVCRMRAPAHKIISAIFDLSHRTRSRFTSPSIRMVPLSPTVCMRYDIYDTDPVNGCLAHRLP